ncbi:ABC transporter ATP-binding protein [Thermus tengchongensis]|nr:ABC transporter ATP-binding protein [Thermus tengchongensis]
MEEGAIMEERVIEVAGLAHSFGRVWALKSLTFHICPGEQVALLGPNGAGKTTLVNILGGFLRPTRGRVRVLGVETDRLGPSQRAQMGFVFQERPGLYPDLTVGETLDLFRGYYRNPVSTALLLEALGLTDKVRRFVRHLSGGERRRLELAVALVGRPRLLFLDEPTANLDPEGRRWVWERVETLAGEGVTVLLTTHYLSEAERLGRRILLLREGALLFDGSPQDMVARAGLPHHIRFHLPGGALPPDLAPRARAQGEGWVLQSHAPLEDLERLRQWGAEVFQVQGPSLEEAYLTLMREERHGLSPEPSA